MIRRNNPDVDVDALEARVRAAAAHIRERRTDAMLADVEADIRLASALDRRPAIEALLERAEARNAPRRDLPPRFKRFARAGRAALAVFNYAFKQQREVDAALIAALTELLEVQTAIAERLRLLADQVRAGRD
jgi:hypothetical protein